MYISLELILYVALMSFCLFFRKNNLGLVGTYIFVFYTGMMVYKTSFINPSGNTSWAMYLYTISGLLVVGTVMFGFHKENPMPLKNKVTE